MEKRFTEEQIAFALHQAEQGVSVVEATRKMGLAHDIANTFYFLSWEWGNLV